MSAFFNKYFEWCKGQRECFRKQFLIKIADSPDDLTFHELVVAMSKHKNPALFESHFRPMVCPI